ncbi:MAG: hypothetical protein RSE21_05330 [Bacilli bacterium]
MKNKILTISFVLFLFLFLIMNFTTKDIEISKNERRNLTQLPKISIKNILDKSYMDKFEKYTLDQFPLRNDFRHLKSFINYNVFNKLDNNKIYIKNNYIFKSDYPLNNESIKNFTNKIDMINKKYLTKKNKVYLSIIPDKNYYFKDKNTLNINYEELISNVTTKLDYIKYIDLTKSLDLDSYYQTDTHWKQEKLENVITKLSNEMNFNKYNGNYIKNEYNKFYGVYYGQAAIKRKPEKITYLTNENIKGAKVSHYESKKSNKVYNESKLEGIDSYDVFLDGASSLIEIENDNIKNNKELIIFRDSFGSSIAPLLIDSYKKITLIDLRYISSDNLKDLVSFKEQDILFLYSALVINNSFTLK